MADEEFTWGLDRADGSVTWKRAIARDNGWNRLSTTVADGIHFVIRNGEDDQSRLVGLSTDSGEPICSVSLNGCARVPVVVDDRVYVQVSESLQGYDLTDRRPRTTFVAEDPVFTPVAGQDRLYLPTLGGVCGLQGGAEGLPRTLGGTRVMAAAPSVPARCRSGRCSRRRRPDLRPTPGCHSS